MCPAPNYGIVEDNVERNNKFKGKNLHCSTNLNSHKKIIMPTTYFKCAHDNIENCGILWEIPPSIIKKTSYDLKESCWKDFFNGMAKKFILSGNSTGICGRDHTAH